MLVALKAPAFDQKIMQRNEENFSEELIKKINSEKFCEVYFKNFVHLKSGNYCTIQLLKISMLYLNQGGGVK